MLLLCLTREKEVMGDPNKKKSFLSTSGNPPQNHEPGRGQNGHPYFRVGQGDENEGEEYEEGYESSSLLTDEIDHQILMHRDAHFGGDFEVMLRYYANEENIGLHPDFDIERISYLAEIEKGMGQDLAPLILSGAEAEAVSRARHAYSQFKEIYAREGAKTPLPRLIADLILSEEEEPEGEIEAVVAQGTSIVPDLISLLKSDEMYDPLFPGYGYAPYLAIRCLGKIGDRGAIIPIFETLSKPIIFDEMVIVEALAHIGEPAKEFLLKILKSRPLTQDNPNAAFALISFSYDPQVALACFEQLQDPQVQVTPLLRAYILGNCQSLNTTSSRDAFIKMANDPNTPSELRADMKQIIKEWRLG
jgi:hypothetical protein